jgi:hypothetical protein
VAKKTKHGRPIFHIAARKGVAKAIWKHLRSIEDQRWDLPKNKSILARYIGKKDTDVIYFIEDSHVQNRRMRTIISRHLKRAHLQRKRSIGNWIVHDWGRITRGRKSSVDWTYDLGSFKPSETDEFVKKLHKNRISSWSKILAFADQHNHAIYDSRTSVALNVILDAIGNENRFYMPPTRNTAFPEVIKHIKAWTVANSKEKPRDRYRTYFDYIQLLKDIKETCNVNDITEIEMRLFALAEDFAKQYAEKYDIRVAAFEKAEKAKQLELNLLTKRANNA